MASGRISVKTIGGQCGQLGSTDNADNWVGFDKKSSLCLPPIPTVHLLIQLIQWWQDLLPISMLCWFWPGVDSSAIIVHLLCPPPTGSLFYGFKILTSQCTKNLCPPPTGALYLHLQHPLFAFLFTCFIVNNIINISNNNIVNKLKTNKRDNVCNRQQFPFTMNDYCNAPIYEQQQ